MRPAAENMLPANVRVRTNPVNAAALPGQHLALSTGRRLIPTVNPVVIPVLPTGAGFTVPVTATAALTER